jgi:hypothetical protein
MASKTALQVQKGKYTTGKTIKAMLSSASQEPTGR